MHKPSEAIDSEEKTTKEEKLNAVDDVATDCAKGGHIDFSYC